MQETLADVLGQFVQRSHYSRGQLDALSGVPKRTIANWLEGRVKKPQRWQGLVKLAAVLHLDEAETTHLLQTAEHQPVVELQKIVEKAEDVALLAPWLQETVPPFQATLDLSYFVGREQVLEEMVTALQKGAFVNICNVWGMGGVGKTAVAARLAYQLQSHFPDGVLWANLATSEPMTILSMFAKTYDQDVSMLTDLTERSTFVRGILAHKRVLIILDDAQNSEQIRPLLPPTTGKPAVIITTRYDLTAADGFTRFEIKPFSPESGNSLALFAHFLNKSTMQQEQANLIEIATALGHLPLAIAIAAARLKYAAGQTVATFLNQIRQQNGRLDQLIREDRGIRLSFDVSYQALSSEQQMFFVALGAFGGQDFNVEAVTAVTELPLDIATTNLHQLIHLSLVREEANQRYSLHPLLRDYAREKIQQKAIFERMVIFYVSYVQQNETDYPVLDLETNNILAALQTAHEQELKSLLIIGVDTVYPFLEARGLHETAQNYLTQALQVAHADHDTPNAAQILSNLAHLAYIRADYAQAEEHVHTGLNLTQQIDIPFVRARLLHRQAAIHIDQGNLPQAEAALLEALALARQNGESKNLSDILSLLGKVVAISRGDYDQVEVYLQEGYTLAQQLKDQNRISVFLTQLGALAYHRGQWQQAEAYCLKGLAASRQTGNLRQEANQLHSLGAIAQGLGKFAQAETYLKSALLIGEKIHLYDMIPVTLTSLGEITLEQGKLDAAKKYLQQAVAHSRTIEHPANLSYALSHLGAVVLKEGNYRQAKEYLQEALDLSLEAGQVWDKFTALRWQGALHLAQEEFGEAKFAWNQAKELAEETDTQELLGIILFQLAQLEQAQGNLTEAVRLGQEGVAILEQLGHYLHAEVDIWLSTFSITSTSKENLVT